MQFDGLDPGYWVYVACDDSAAGLGEKGTKASVLTWAGDTSQEWKPPNSD